MECKERKAKMKEQIKHRREIDSMDTWAMEDMYASDEVWEKDFCKMEKYCEELKSWKGKIFENGKSLAEFLKIYVTSGLLLGRVYVYAHQKYHEDTTNSVYQGLSERASNLNMKYQSAISYVEPEILSLSKEQFEAVWSQCKEFLPKEDVHGYERFFFEIMRKKEHSLSAEMEELLANGREVLGASGTIFSMFQNADLKFPSIKDENGEQAQVTHGRFLSFLQNKEQRVRKEAFQSVYSQYESFKNTLAATYSANVKQDVFYATTRKYKSALEMALDQTDVPVEVYHNLLQVVREHLPLLHRYMQIRKKIMNLETLHMYDLYVPMVEEISEKIDFETAKDMVREGLLPLGAEYGEVLEKAFLERWIDKYENKGKRSGAYSWGTYSVHPYVLLNHQNDLNSVFTLAHEMGHALHSYYSNLYQPYICAGYEIFVAEVASTCNEALLIHDLLEKTTEKQKKAYLLNYQLEQFRTTLFRQTMFAEFELLVHEKAEKGEALTAQTLCEVYRQLNLDYFGDAVTVDEEINMEWARIPHFYNSFYVYQYATGYSAAIALSSKILKEGECAVKKYIEEFLQGGGSKSPMDLLKGAGVDMSQKEPIEEAMKVFEQLLDEIEELLQ